MDGFEEPRSLARLNGTAGRRARSPQTGRHEHARRDQRSIKTRIAELQTTMPPDFKITYTRDQSKFISESFHAVQEHLIWAASSPR